MTYNDLGYAYYKLNRITESIAAYQEAIRLRPTYAKALNGLGDDLNRQKRFSEAVEILKRAIAVQSDYVKHFNLGLAYFGMQDYRSATEELTAVIREKPDFGPAYKSLTTVYSVQGKSNEAIAAAQQAVKLLPQDAEAKKNLGSAYLRFGKFAEAISAYQDALSISAGDPETQTILGWPISSQPNIRTRLETSRKRASAAKLCRRTLQSGSCVPEHERCKRLRDEVLI